MSEENQEMISDIVREMRQGMNPNGTAECQYLESYICTLADRIEAAWKREKAEIEADALNVGAIVATTEKSSTVGNAAATREALNDVISIADREFNAFRETAAMKEMRDKCCAALASPPRNCDRFNSGDPTKDAADAYDEWQRHCDCSLMPQSCKVESAFRQWLFASAKSEAKGESDGSK